MSKSKLMKIVLVGILSLMLIFVATQVFADDDDGFTDLTGSVSNNTTDTNTVNNTTDTNTANNTTDINTTLDNNTTLNLTTDTNTVNNTTNNAAVNTTYNTANNYSSSYDNSNLPSTGIGETTSVIFVIVALIISAVIAYIKVNYYKNI